MENLGLCCEITALAATLLLWPCQISTACFGLPRKARMRI
jgi:hypothetical protein